MKTFFKNLLLPSSGSIISSFTKAIDALETKGAASNDLANEYTIKELEARQEALQCQRYARNLRSALTD